MGSDSDASARANESKRADAAAQDTGDAAALDALMAAAAIETVYQPIVGLADGQRVGYECLTRGAWPGMPASPGELLRRAAELGREVELAELMRVRSISDAGEAGLAGAIFVNIHPAEVNGPERLVHQLKRLAGRWPQLQLVLELHEGAVTDAPAVRRLRDHLAQCDIQLAYDDFGSGQARLMELSAVPPRYLKFDAALIRGIDRAPKAQYRLVEMLVSYARENGVITLAEGIGEAAELEACRSMGFDWGQGYYFGEPESLA